jgi:hypothetical protein
MAPSLCDCRLPVLLKMAKRSWEIATAYRLEQFFGGIGKHLKDRRK